MRLPRFTLRRAMILVALVSLVFGVIRRGEGRRARFRAIRRLHYVEAMKAQLNEQRAKQAALPKFTERMAVHRASVKYHASMGDKYRKAEKFPWLPVAPDPPEPN